MRRLLPRINRIVGVIVLLIGLCVTYYGVYEIRLFFAGGDAADPVIEAAGVLQGWLADGVYALGVWPLLAALAVLAAAAVARWYRTAGRAASRCADLGDPDER